MTINEALTGLYLLAKNVTTKDINVAIFDVLGTLGYSGNLNKRLAGYSDSSIKLFRLSDGTYIRISDGSYIY